jgi:hypothetical protein
MTGFITLDSTGGVERIIIHLIIRIIILLQSSVHLSKKFTLGIILGGALSGTTE